jgi:uncharacterized protein
LDGFIVYTEEAAMSAVAQWDTLTTKLPPALPAMPDLMLDGYLTGIVVGPRPIPLARWLAILFAGEDLMLRDAGLFRAEHDMVIARHAALADDIDRHLARLERDRICDYQPAFLPRNGKPAHTTIRQWAAGFAMAMALAPDAWSALLEDERTQVIAMPLIGFLGVEDPTFEPVDDIEQRLDEAAVAIPRAILILRKLAVLRATCHPARSSAVKLGRNDACPCGSGAKYKRCCGRR